MYEARIDKDNLHIIERFEDTEHRHTIQKRELDTVKYQVKQWLSLVTDQQGKPVNAQQILDDGKTVFIDECAYFHLALLAILATARMSRKRLLVLAIRLDKFSREECMYWLSRATYSRYGDTSKRWAVSGLRLMLCGNGDEDETREVYDNLI